jgi:hypothetical protein
MSIPWREQWLSEMARSMEVLFGADDKFREKAYRVTCGWPSKHATGTRKVRVGECHRADVSADGRFELFVSPLLAEPLDVAGTLCHELAHVVAGVEAGHKAPFVKVCRAVGLTAGKPSQAGPGPLLNDQLRKLIDRLGPYPHAAMKPPVKAKAERPPSSLRLACLECGCVVSIGAKWLAESGPPTCGCGGVMDASPEVLEAILEHGDGLRTRRVV